MGDVGRRGGDLRGAAQAAAAGIVAAAMACGMLPLAAPAPAGAVQAQAYDIRAVPGGGACVADDLLATAVKCSLARAVERANSQVFPNGGARIAVDGGAHAVGASVLVLQRSMTIERRAGTTGTPVISGADVTGIFEVRAGATATIRGVTLTDGKAARGAGVHVLAGATLNLFDSTVQQGYADDEGGGIANYGTATVNGSTFVDNEARRRGGALYNAGTASVTNSTVHRNRSNAGGGIISTGTATLVQLTITVNESRNRLGGGLQRQGGVVHLYSSIIADNISNSGTAKDCSGSPYLADLNLIANPAGCNPTGTPPIARPAQLGELADNGGPTQTRALLPGSPAKDPVGGGCPTLVDQRGVTRPSGAGCDLGAYELETFGVDVELAATPVDGTTPDEALVAGAAAVPLDALEQLAETLPAGSGPEATALRSIALRSIALRSITLESVALRSIALRSIALRSIALRSIALRSIFTAPVALRSIALRSILLSDVDLLNGLTWQQLLGAGFDDSLLQTLTLEDVADGLAASSRQLTVQDVDLSATRLGSISIASLLLGSTALRSIPLDLGTFPDPQPTTQAEAWCSLLVAGACDTAAETDQTLNGSLVSLDLAGIALRSIALRSILLSGPLSDPTSPLRSITVGDLGTSAGAVVDCTSVCPPATTTLGVAFDTGDVLATSSLADVLLALFDAGDVAWEDFDLEGGDVQAIADPTPGVARRVDYAADVVVTGETAAVVVDVTLPYGFGLVTGSTAPAAAAVTVTPPAAGAATGPTIRLALAAAAPGTYRLSFSAWSSLRIGPALTTVVATATAGTRTASDTDAVTLDVGEVYETGEASAAAESAVDLPAEPRLQIGHLSFEGDVDYFRFTVPEGSTARLRLGNLPEDYDLVLYGPPGTPLRQPGTEARDLLPDHLLDLVGADDALTAEPTADVPQSVPFDGSVVVHRVSARRSTEAEQIDTGSLRQGTYIVQVSGSNGASSADPYSLRVQVQPPVDRGACRNVDPAVPASLRAGTPDLTGVDTLFLVNTQRLARDHGATAASGVLAALDGLVAAAAGDPSFGFRAAVVPLEHQGTAVNDAYAAWDADRCSPARANAVVRAVGAAVDGLRGTNTITNVVLVGDDTQIPFARVVDTTALSNEQSFADAFTGNNELVAALAGGYVLTDNAYASSAGITVNDHELFVPELAIGRLVESPAEIIGAVERFQATKGTLSPSSALVTGYDFLADGAEAVAAALGSGTERLIDETWDADDLEAAIAALDGPDAIASINAHFDHARALPAAGNTTGDETDLFEVDRITGAVADALDDALLFSMGCHAGLSVADVTVGATPDWAQTFSGVASGWVGNTGFGYGDTELVALSEELMAIFARHLVAGEPAGRALALAKQEYAAAVALVSAYDEKVVHQATLYGFPMLQVAGAGAGPTSSAKAVGADATAETPAGSSATVALTPDPVTGLLSAPFERDFAVTNGAPEGPDALTRESTPDGTYFHVDGDTLDQAHRPVQPRTSEAYPRSGGLQATGVLLTGLESIDLRGFRPLFFSPTVDLGAHEPRSVSADATFPSRFADVVSTPGPAGPEERVVLVPGQFRASTTPGVGLQRLFTAVDGVVYYGAGPDPGGPVGLRNTEARFTGTTVDFDVELDRDAQRVVVLFKEDGESRWYPVELTSTDGSTWRGAMTTTLSGTRAIEYLVQAVSAAGHVYSATSKGGDFGAAPGGTVEQLTVEVEGEVPPNGWFDGPVTLLVTGATCGELEYALDGATPGPIPNGTSTTSPDTCRFVVGTDGFTRVDVFDPATGTSAATLVAIDASPPVVAVQAVPDVPVATSPVDVTISGAESGTEGSGVRSVSYTIAGVTTVVQGTSTTLRVDTDGTTSITAWATDVAGNDSATVTRDVRVDLTDPTATITSPGAGTGVQPGASLIADYACADGTTVLTGAGCTGTLTKPGGATQAVADGAALDTSVTGTYTLAVTATDAAGRTSTATRTYTVGYRICLLYNPSRATTIGSAVPIRLQLCDAAGRNLSSPTISLEARSIDLTQPVPPNDQGSSNQSFRFRYDTGLQGYIYNLDTTGLPAGEHNMQFVVVGSDVVYNAPFKLR